MCTDKDIKDLLPAYLEQGLDRDEQLRVEGHLAVCEDCRSELSLLRIMSGEPVPDPGDAFWSGMPARVRRAVQEQQSRKKVFELSRITDWMVLPHWAVAVAAVGLVVIAAWFFVRQPAHEIARTAVPLEQEMLSDAGISTPSINVEELSSTEFAAATQWAQNEYAPIRKAITEDTSENQEQDISEELSNLTPRELDRVYELLKQKEQDAREKLRKKNKKDNDLG
ncbi:MAG TPA: zf-HC2 domain-containing protein [Nitrospirota bacterium]